MGGCRCAYRGCESSTGLTPGLHYFHFPIRDPARCEKWIQNARKPSLRTLEKDKLRNKVICNLHFEEKFFTNSNGDRLVHNAIPTLGFEDYDGEEYPNNQEIEDNIQLIPIDKDNTKFALPNIEFPGISYTIFDDAVIPTSTIQDVIIKELEKNPAPTVKIKDIQVKSVVNQIKQNLPISINGSKVNKQSNTKRKQIKRKEKENATLESDLLEPDINIKIMDQENMANVEVAPEPSEEEMYSEIIHNNETWAIADCSFEHPEIVLKSPQLERKTNAPESQTAAESIARSFEIDEDLLEEEHIVHEIETVDIKPEKYIYNMEDEEIILVQDEPENIRVEKHSPGTSVSNTSLDENKTYRKMIQSHSKQIKRLRKFAGQQNKFNRYICQRKQLPKFRRTYNTKLTLIQALKNQVKPSLLAILKLELLPHEDIVLTDQEEEFLTELYINHPECYHLLQKKFGWNLPSASIN